MSIQTLPNQTLNQINFGQPTLLMFPGQGEQHVGMAKDLVNASSAAKAVMEEADDVLGISLSKLCFEGPEDELNDTINSQPAVVAASMAALATLEANRDKSHTDNGDRAPALWIAGHSLGEYSALVAAGAIAYSDALRLVRERGRLMKIAGEKQPGRMAAILGLDDKQIDTICQDISQSHGIVQIANYNCPGQVVISGEEAAINAAMTACEDAKARKVVPLAVSVAAHSPLMRPAIDELRAAIEATPISPLTIPLIANTSAKPIEANTPSTIDEIKAELVDQLTGSVRWTATAQFAISQGVNSFIEIGPGKTLTSLVKRIERKSNRINLNSPENIAKFVDSL